MISRPNRWPVLIRALVSMPIPSPNLLYHLHVLTYFQSHIVTVPCLIILSCYPPWRSYFSRTCESIKLELTLSFNRSFICSSVNFKLIYWKEDCSASIWSFPLFHQTLFQSWHFLHRFSFSSVAALMPSILPAPIVFPSSPASKHVPIVEIALYNKPDIAYTQSSKQRKSYCLLKRLSHSASYCRYQQALRAASCWAPCVPLPPLIHNLSIIGWCLTRCDGEKLETHWNVTKVCCAMSGTPLLKHDTLFKLGLLSGEIQSLILSVLLQWRGEEEVRSKKNKGGGWRRMQRVRGAVKKYHRGLRWEEKDGKAGGGL